MQTTGIIRADGSIQYHGYTPMNSRLLAITDELIVIHHGGGRYWDNGGEHYVSASIEIKTLRFLKPGNAEGTWEFGMKSGRGARWHPTPKEAARQVMHDLNDGLGEKIKRKIEERGE